MNHNVKRVLRNVTGFALILLGIVGLVLPILQGILFIVLGLGLIDILAKRRLHRWLSGKSRLYRWVALQHHRAKRKFSGCAKRDAPKGAPSDEAAVSKSEAESKPGDLMADTATTPPNRC